MEKQKDERKIENLIARNAKEKKSTGVIGPGEEVEEIVGEGVGGGFGGKAKEAGRWARTRRMGIWRKSAGE